MFFYGSKWLPQTSIILAIGGIYSFGKTPEWLQRLKDVTRASVDIVVGSFNFV